MSEYRRQHPVASITRAIDLVRGNLVTIIILMVFGAGGGGSSFLWMFAGLLLFLLLSGVAGWWRFHYRVEGDELQIRYGVLVRKNLYLTRDRIQVTDISSGLVQRLFGLVKVEIKTAGSTSREAFLSAVRREEAERLVELLRGGEHVRETEQDGENAGAHFRLPLKELLIAASTSGSFGIAFSLIATVFSQVEPLLDETQLYEWFLATLPGEANMFFVLSLLLVFVIFAWLVSFIGTLLRFGGFSLHLSGEEFVVQQGILEKKRITLPFNRIQAVRVVEGLIRQPLGYAAIYVESAGYGEQREAGSVVLMPLIRRDRVKSFLEKTLPEYSCRVEALRPPARALLRYMIRSSAVLALVLAAVQWLLSAPPLIWSLLLLGLLWGWLRFRDAAAGTDERRLVIRSRLLASTTAIVHKNRIQDLTLQASWIQARRRLSNLIVSVASGDQGRSFQVRELDEKQVGRFFGWISRDANGGGSESRPKTSDAVAPDPGSQINDKSPGGAHPLPGWS